jgi:O-antigen ligase
LKIFFELGVIGLLLILLAFANVLRISREALRVALRKDESETAAILFALIFGLIGIMVAIFFVDIYSPWLFVWAFIGTAMRLTVVHNTSGKLVVHEDVRYVASRPAAKLS